MLDEENRFDKKYGFFAEATLNRFMASGRMVWREIRQRLMRLFRGGDGVVKQERTDPPNEVQMHLPVSIGDYTDFYASREHATNVGIMLRGKENALIPELAALAGGLSWASQLSNCFRHGCDSSARAGQAEGCAYELRHDNWILN